METSVISLASGDFILGDDGIYVATILATQHELGTSIYITKAQHRNSDLTLDNIILSYQIETNGDIKVFASEPTSMRLTVVKDV